MLKSYKDGNEAWQDKDEMDVYSIISKGKKAIKLLSEDKIDVDKICDVSKYPVIDKERPSLCVDRLDGILSAAYLWTKEFDLETIKELVNLVVLCFQKESGNHLIESPSRKNYVAELCLADNFNSFVNATDFLDAINLYSTWQRSKESRYAIAFLGEILCFMDKQGVIPQNYFNLSEEEMIQRFLASPYAFLWKDFTNLNWVTKVLNNNSDEYILNPETKIRFCYPLVMIPDYFGFRPGYYPSDDIAYEDYIKIEKAIIENRGPLYSEISEESKKLLLENRRKSR